MRRAVFFVAAFALLASSAARSQDTALAAKINAITSRPEFRHAMWGIKFV